jgi:hypothetical protein
VYLKLSEQIYIFVWLSLLDSDLVVSKRKIFESTGNINTPDAGKRHEKHVKDFSADYLTDTPNRNLPKVKYLMY